MSWGGIGEGVEERGSGFRGELFVFVGVYGDGWFFRKVRGLGGSVVFILYCEFGEGISIGSGYLFSLWFFYLSLLVVFR